MGPIIICGMHRSGTSLVSRALESAGLFVGDVKEHNHEAVFFLTLNQWMFEQLGASWDNPYNMRFINDDLAGYLLAVIANIERSSSAVSFTGADPRHQQVFHQTTRSPGDGRIRAIPSPHTFGRQPFPMPGWCMSAAIQSMWRPVCASVRNRQWPGTRNNWRK